MTDSGRDTWADFAGDDVSDYGRSGLTLGDLRVGCEPDAIYFGRPATFADLVEAALSEGGEVVEALKRLNGEGRFSWQIPAYYSGPYLLIPLESKE